MSSLPARMRLIKSKMKELECSQDFSHYKSMGIFPDAQGQLNPHSLVRSGRISNSSEMLWMSSLPASMKKTRLKIEAIVFTILYINFSDAQGQITLAGCPLHFGAIYIFLIFSNNNSKGEKKTVKSMYFCHSLSNFRPWAFIRILETIYSARWHPF